jgi:hypothetical protein
MFCFTFLGDYLLRFYALATVMLLDGILGFANTLTYKEAEALWLKNKGTVSFSEYMTTFAEFNNKNHLDERGGCYKKASGPIHMFLVLNKDGVIESALIDVTNEKSVCFQKSYSGLKAPKPPYTPFIVNMSMR